MLKFIYSVTVLVFGTFTIFSQSKLAPAYVELVDGKKIEGYVEVLNDIESEVRVKFYKNEGSKAKKYKAKDIKSYGYEKTHTDEAGKETSYWRHYKQMTMDRPPRVMATNISLVERLSDQTIRLYKFIYDTPSDLEEPESILYIVRREGKSELRVEKENFKFEAKKLFHDYTALVTLVGKKKYRFENFKRLVDDYNFWLENKHDPSVYKMNPKIFSGQKG